MEFEIGSNGIFDSVFVLQTSKNPLVAIDPVKDVVPGECGYITISKNGVTSEKKYRAAAHASLQPVGLSTFFVSV